MTDDAPGTTTYANFLAENPARRGDAREIGQIFRNQSDALRQRIVWYAETHELTVERFDLDELDLEDFHSGVIDVEIIGQFDPPALERALGPWPHVERWMPRTLQRLRQLLAS